MNKDFSNRKVLIRADSPEWLKELFPQHETVDAFNLPRESISQVSKVQTSIQPATPKTDPASSDNFNPHARPDGGVYGRD